MKQIYMVSKHQTRYFDTGSKCLQTVYFEKEEHAHKYMDKISHPDALIMGSRRWWREEGGSFTVNVEIIDVQQEEI